MGETTSPRLDSNDTSVKNNTTTANNDVDVVVVVNNQNDKNNFANVIVNIGDNESLNHNNKMQNIGNDASNTEFNTKTSTDLIIEKDESMQFIDEGFSSDEKLKKDDDDDSVDKTSSDKLWASKSNPNFITGADIASVKNDVNKSHIIDI